jgi:hypothetical protein
VSSNLGSLNFGGQDCLDGVFGPRISGVELLMGTAALAGLVIGRFYFLRERGQPS